MWRPGNLLKTIGDAPGNDAGEIYHNRLQEILIPMIRKGEISILEASTIIAACNYAHNEMEEFEIEMGMMNAGELEKVLKPNRARE